MGNNQIFTPPALMRARGFSFVFLTLISASSAVRLSIREMNKQLIVFGVVGFLWCFALGFLFYNQTISPNYFDNEVISSAAVSLPRKEPANPVTILAFGDMMLDRKVREQINGNGPEYPFVLIKDFLQGNDVVAANAEGPFTYNNSVTLGVKNAPLQFTFDPMILPTLKSLGFTLLGQANNHTLNFGTTGLNQSTSSIEMVGLNWFGDPRNKETGTHVVEVRGEKIAFIGYNEFAYDGLNNVLQAIKDVKKDVAFVVVYSHWGEEYNPSFTFDQQKVAHAFIDAGADAVIGMHPHVIEPIETYNNKIIFYSLGNFIFDQSATGPTSRGLAVRISLAPKSVTYDLFPISISKQQAALMIGEDRQVELDRLNVQTGTIIVLRGQVVK
jgi:gamma-polyglutamate biosynthesis protein CapA